MPFIPSNTAEKIRKCSLDTGAACIKKNSWGRIKVHETISSDKFVL